MITDIIKNTETRMKKCNESFKNHLQKIHVSRITPNILDNVKIKDHSKGTHTPLRYLANIITKNARTLIITVFDATTVKNIEKTIINSDLNLNVSSKGNIIHVYSPVLTQDRRQHLVKLVYNEAEKTKISIRNIRRSVNEEIKKSVKNKIFNTEQEHYLQNNVQKLTDIWTKKINEITKKKEIELNNF